METRHIDKCSACGLVPPLIHNTRIYITPFFIKYISGGFVKNEMVYDRPDIIWCETCNDLLRGDLK